MHRKSISRFAIALALTMAMLLGMTGGIAGLPGGNTAAWAVVDNTGITYYERRWDTASSKLVENSNVVNHYMLLNSSNANWYDIGSDFLTITYVVRGNVNLSSHTTLRVSGNTKLVLCEGATLTVGDGIYIKRDATLKIYSQTTDQFKWGKLISKPDSGPGIGGMANTIGGRLEIHGGYIDVKGGTNAAGIGGGNHNSGMESISIYGGEIHAQGGSSGAGIGEGQQNNYNETINIYGGDVYATGGSYGAGIGGGEDRGGGIINIYGGEVHAQGGHDGAGIGGGESGSQNQPVTIYGGTVYATGGANGAGIGGGEHGRGAPFTMEGGWLYATGGDDHAAGIGSGKGADGGTTIINGGNVHAYGANKGPGIGANSDNIGTIRINGGIVEAYGDGGGAGIGSTLGNNLKSGEITIEGGAVYAQGYRGPTSRKYYAAGIGAGECISGDGGGDCCIPITISGGTVKAYGLYGSAGIGAALGGNLKGPIRISGGYVYAETIGTANDNEVAAAIGAGAEMTGNFDVGGGVCDTKIEITGGTVEAIINAEPVSGIKPQAIGHGSGDKRNDGVVIYDGAMVRVGDSSDLDSVEPLPAADRMSGINRLCMQIMPCTHQHTTKTVDVETHTITCAYCKTYSVTEPHQFIGDETKCAVCGLGDEYPLCNIALLRATTVNDLINKAYATVDRHAILNTEYMLPECQDELEGYVFTGYQASKLTWTETETETGTGYVAEFTPLSDQLLQPGDIYPLTVEDNKVVVIESDETDESGDNEPGNNESGSNESNSNESNSTYYIWFVPIYKESATLSFDAGEGSGAMDPEKLVKGSSFTLPGSSFTVPEGKKFKCWKISETEYNEDDEITVTEDMTAVAQYVNSSTFDISCGESATGTVTTKAESADAGTEIIVDVKAKNGYRIVSLKMNGQALTSTDTDEEEKTYTFTMPEADVTLTAEFELIEYTITYELNGGTAGGSNPGTYTVETESIMLAAPTGNTDFVGWYLSPSFKGAPLTQLEKGEYHQNMILYACWQSVLKAAPAPCTLTYNGTEQALVTAGQAEGGTLLYAVTTLETEAAEEDAYTTEIPTGIAAGTYHVWYKISGDAQHSDVAPGTVSVSIANPSFGTPDMVLPADLKEIQANAFENIAAGVVVIPDGCTAIRAGAFKDCHSLTRIRIPASVTVMEENAFDGTTAVYVFGEAGSTAESYCGEYTNLIFIAE